MKITVGNLRHLIRESIGYQELPRRTVTIEGHEVDCEVADTDPSRMQGLMHRQDLPQNAGMLFVFPWSEQQSFWMRDTHIPLDVAFADMHGKILNIESGSPMSERKMLSQGPAMYVLEVPKGWFNLNGLGAGSMIDVQGIDN
jgi:uncharacterized membrane protein (UPF0127 family)